MSTNVQIIQNIEKLEGLSEQWKKHPWIFQVEKSLHCHAMKCEKKGVQITTFQSKINGFLPEVEDNGKHFSFEEGCLLLKQAKYKYKYDHCGV